MPVERGAADRIQLGFGQRAACHGDHAGLIDTAVDTGSAKVAQKLVGRLADQRVETNDGRVARMVSMMSPNCVQPTGK